MADKRGKNTVLPVSVKRVVDGDTVRFARRGLFRWFFPGSELVVRLYGIDAPEGDQKYGRESSMALKRFMRGGDWMVEVRDYDRYGRAVGLIYKKSRGRDNSVNLRMVNQGWAHAYTRYGGRELGFVDAEREAKREKRGMWRRDRRLESPEKWRARKRKDKSIRRKIKFRLALGVTVLGVMLFYTWWMWLR